MPGCRIFLYNPYCHNYLVCNVLTRSCWSVAFICCYYGHCSSYTIVCIWSVFVYLFSICGSSEVSLVAAIGPMAPSLSPVFRALAFIFSMAPILRVASIEEAKPHAVELRGLLSGSINRQDLQLYLRSKGLRASEQTRCSICAMDAMQDSSSCTLREANSSDLTELLPDLRAIFAFEGIIDPARIDLYLRMRGLRASKRSRRTLCSRAMDQADEVPCLSMAELMEHLPTIQQLLTEEPSMGNKKLCTHLRQAGVHTTARTCQSLLLRLSSSQRDVRGETESACSHISSVMAVNLHKMVLSSFVL